ncbi:hypothetical protein WEI85_33395 [Actinomycetes bacterium KLBMP 9797]
MSIRRTLGVGLALLIGAGLALAGPIPAHAEDDAEVGAPFLVEVPAEQWVAPAGGACTWLYTKDPAPTGAAAYVCKTWTRQANGEYRGELWGRVYDTDPDGRSAYLRVKCDARTQRAAQANGAADSPKYFSGRYENCAWVGYRLGLVNTSNGEKTYWSNWW